MKTALKLSGLALVLALGTAAAASRFEPRYHGACADACTPTVGDPDPADCPFCGGNPQLHVQRMFELERVQTALLTTLLR